jgi:hypothetical protein
MRAHLHRALLLEGADAIVIQENTERAGQYVVVTGGHA